MKKLIILGFMLVSIDASAAFKDYSDNVTAAKYVKYNDVANKTVSASKKHTFKIGTTMFELFYDRSAELVLLTRFDDMENRWRWVLVGDVDQLERDCRAEDNGADCSALAPYLIDFTERATTILKRDYGGVVVIPDSWEDQLDHLIANNVSFDEANLELSFTY